MPKKPTHHHPLRDIRSTIDKTQPEMASLLGLDRSTIQKIENGNFTMTSRIAFLIHMQTGCDLIDGPEIASTCCGIPYEKSHFDATQALRKKMKWDSDVCCPAFATALALLFRAAQEKGELPAVWSEIADTLLTITKNHKLSNWVDVALDAKDYDISEAERKDILDLFPRNPVRAGLELNLRKGSQSRWKKKKEKLGLKIAEARERRKAEKRGKKGASPR